MYKKNTKFVASSGNSLSRVLQKLMALGAIVCLLGPVLFAGNDVSQNNNQYNILFLISDDMNDWIGCLGGHPDAITPNLDRLAERSILFEQAHCSAPICNPSRASIMSGLNPSTS